MRQIFVSILLSSLANLAISQTSIECISGDTIQLNAPPHRGTIQWQKSFNTASYTDIPNATVDTFQYIPSNGIQYVRAAIFEENCPVLYSSVITINAASMNVTANYGDPVLMESLTNYLVSDSAEMASGVFTFQNLPNTTIETGDVLVSVEGDGFIRLVQVVTINGTTTTCQTTEATLNDLFDNDSFSFDLSNDSLEVRSGGFNHNFSNLVLYEAGPVSLTLDNGTVGMSGNWTGVCDYSLLGGLDYFNFATNNAQFFSNFDVILTANGGIQPASGSTNLASFERPFVIITPTGIPVVISLEADLELEYEVEVNADVMASATCNTNVGMQMNVQYSNEQWSNSYQLNPTQTIQFNTPQGQVSASVNLTLVPTIRMKIYGVLVPFMQPAAHLDISGRVHSPSLNWDVTADVYGTMDMGFNLEIFGEAYTPFAPIEFEGDHQIYQTPKELRYQNISGNNQVGVANTPLPEPCRLKVVDSFGAPQSNVQVYLQTSAGSGSVNNTTLVTDETGWAEFIWTLGNEPIASQSVSATIRDGNNVQIGQALVYTAQDIILEIGDYHAGGIIFSLDASGQHGWVAAPADAPAGEMNFSDALAYAAQYVNDGFSDWALPTYPQLAEMALYTPILGLSNLCVWDINYSQSNCMYHSSTPSNFPNPLYPNDLYFMGFGQNNDLPFVGATGRTRPIRAF
jgi:hypothetical protein